MAESGAQSYGAETASARLEPSLAERQPPTMIAISKSSRAIKPVKVACSTLTASTQDLFPPPGLRPVNRTRAALVWTEV